ncbi:MBL fold metallo-hydrolase [Marinicellulosiphila megalodicopiae]|uniref:MBL fold metallo-hydrolase n=1 Tax=Marinicellulosiphila megalodicopiae TaxID=2724896 RepID=UPI003BB13E38
MFNFTFKSTDPLREESTIKDKVQASDQFNGKQFVNIDATQMVTNFWAVLKMYLFDKQKPASPTTPIQVQSMTTDQLIALQKQSISKQDMYFSRLGHSTILILMDGEFWLTDPVFSKRASPFSFAGPKRFHQPPLTIEQLPPIKGVLLSHNHYDHLDQWAIQQLINKVEHFYTPLGVGEDLITWGVKPENVTQLDWWESVTVNNLSITAAPAQHFSGRGLGDSNKTLWASWSVKSDQASFYFTGDSGYFGGFKEIGERLGPFDVSFIETGAYNKLWPDVHMMPEESAQAHLDVKATFMVPIHNGTFDLSVHTWTDPFEKIVELSKQKNINLVTPSMGEITSLQSLKEKPLVENYWWE